MKKKIIKETIKVSPETKKITVTIGIPAYGTIEKETHQSIQALKEKLNDKYDFKLVVNKGSALCTLRNLFFERLDTDYFLGVDSDIQFSPENFIQLINCKLPLVFGVYANKGDFSLSENSNFLKGQPGIIDKKTPYEEKGIQKKDWSGMGFFLITKEKVKSIDGGWFNCPIVTRKDGLTKKFTQSEDIGFCMLLGEKVNINFDCKVNHLVRKDELHVMNKMGVSRVDLMHDAWMHVLNGVSKSVVFESANPIIKAISMQLRGQIPQPEQKKN